MFTYGSLHHCITFKIKNMCNQTCFLHISCYLGCDPIHITVGCTHWKDNKVHKMLDCKWAHHRRRKERGPAETKLVSDLRGYLRGHPHKLPYVPIPSRSWKFGITNQEKFTMIQSPDLTRTLQKLYNVQNLLNSQHIALSLSLLI